ncbi:MAG TPA: cytochrome c oxidase subunit II [Acidimicrobiales bacterium]|nr:cytochrome c oxidase subunit II [Acidimicrobiales bacterium]
MNFRNNFGHVFGIEEPIAIAVFVAVMAVLGYAVVFRRRRPGVEPSRKHKHPVLESVYVACVLGMAIFLVVLSFSANHAELTSAGKPALTVRIDAYQWCWTFSYPASHVRVTGNCQGDDYPVLVLPTDTPIEVQLSSADVVHEWWLPYLRFKEEAFPDHVNTFPLRLATTGEWTGICSEFCGLYHDTMYFRMRAVTPSAFRSWLAAHGGTPS